MEPDLSADFEWAQSYKADSGKTSFLDLPKEIRDYVYNLALTVPGAILIQGRYIYTTGRDLKGRAIQYKGQGPPEPRHLDIPIALLRTCRQLHAESTEVLYGRNIFSFQMINDQFASLYRPLLRHIVFFIASGRGIYSRNVEDVSYWWRRVFYPHLVEKGTRLLILYPNLETLTLPIKSDKPGDIWKPAFMMAPYRTGGQRIDMGARWLRAHCSVRDERLCSILGFEERLDDIVNLEERLRQILHLEVQIPYKKYLTREDFVGSEFAFEEEEAVDWDHTEFARAFRQSIGVSV